MATELTDEEVDRRAKAARHLRDRERGASVLDALDEGRASMGRGHDPALDIILSGLLQGAGLQWGDEIFAGARDFEADRASNPELYDASSVVGTLGILPIAQMLTRIPLRARERLFNEAREALSREGVAQRRMDRPGFLRSEEGFDAPLPHTPGAADVATLERRGDAAGALRLSRDRDDALEQTENLLALRRGALDDYSMLDAAGHGAVIGSGGVTPGDTPLEERATGGVLGALGAAALTRGSGEIKDLSGYPLRGARWSAQDVVDLPGPRNQRPDVDEFYGRARMLEEQAHRDLTGDTFLGRAAGPSSTMRENPVVTPLSDSNAMVRAAIAKAQSSPAGAEIMRDRGDRVALNRALESLGGMRTTHAPRDPDAPSTLAPHHREILPTAMREDRMVRPDALRTVMGDERFFAPGGADPAQWSKRQVQDHQRGRVNPRQYPGFAAEQRGELAHLVVEDVRTQAMALARLPSKQQPAAARKLLDYLDDPATRRLMATLRLREGPQSPAAARLKALQDDLERVARHGADYSAVTKGFDRGGGRGAEPAAAEAAHMLSSYPMSRRMAEALLDEQALSKPANAYWVNPEGRGEHPLLQVRRESVRPHWPYAAPPGMATQYAGDALALGVDHANHGIWEALRTQ